LLSVGENPLTDRDHGLGTTLVRALADEPPAPFAVRRFQRLPALAPTLSDGPADGHTGGPSERGFGAHVDMTNRAVVVGERVVVKWLTPPLALPQPAPEILAHLVDAGFNETAPPYAVLTRRDGEEEFLLAVLTGYLPEAVDGWEWCVEAAASGDTGFAPALGGLAARLHLALSTFPGRPQAPVSFGERADQALAEALALMPPGGAETTARMTPRAAPTGAAAVVPDRESLEDGAWLASRAARMREETAVLRRPYSGRLIRIHGDLHVGQVLRWRDGYAVIDFDGNPTLGRAAPYQPAARDVAQLTMSLQHVAQVAIRRRGTPAARARAWSERARERMLAAYRSACDLLDDDLLRPFEVEQECRELIYAARYLPRWRYAPMGVLRTWYPESNKDPM
jgi:maltokinase